MLVFLQVAYTCLSLHVICLCARAHEKMLFSMLVICLTVLITYIFLMCILEILYFGFVL